MMNRYKIQALELRLPRAAAPTNPSGRPEKATTSVGGRSVYGMILSAEGKGMAARTGKGISAVAVDGDGK